MVILLPAVDEARMSATSRHGFRDILLQFVIIPIIKEFSTFHSQGLVNGSTRVAVSMRTSKCVLAKLVTGKQFPKEFAEFDA